MDDGNHNDQKTPHCITKLLQSLHQQCLNGIHILCKVQITKTPLDFNQPNWLIEPENLIFREPNQETYLSSENKIIHFIIFKVDKKGYLLVKLSK